MKKNFFSKPSATDIFELIIKLIIGIFLAALAARFVFSVIILVKLSYDQQEREKEAIGYFNEVCEYVRENEAVFREFSEYQSSLLSDDEDVIDFERTGDMQDKRDIIFKYFHSGNISIDDGELFTRFEGYCGSYYSVVLYIQKDIGKKFEEDEQSKNINDDVLIFLVFKAHG